MSERSPKVVVVGGGYGGITAAKALDDVADVALVEPKTAFVHNVAALRALVDPAWLSRIFLPYDRLLTKGRVIRDRAVRVDATQVSLSSGAALPADFIVLATGSTYPFPAKSGEHDHEAARARYAAAGEELAAAERVLLLGAGPVGLELAGEIRAAWPSKRIVVTDLADDILSGPYKSGLRAELRRQLDELDIALLLGTRLVELPLSQPGARSPFSLSTEGGDVVDADIWYRCFGATPATGYLSGDTAAARTRSGQLDVSPDLRLPGLERVFAVGDIITTDTNLARTAQLQAEVVAANIRAMISGSAELVAYEPPPPGIFVPLGPEGGAGQLPGADEISGPDVVAEIKGRDLMIEHYAETFGLAAERIR